MPLVGVCLVREAAEWFGGRTVFQFGSFAFAACVSKNYPHVGNSLSCSPSAKEKEFLDSSSVGSRVHHFGAYCEALKIEGFRAEVWWLLLWLSV